MMDVIPAVRCDNEFHVTLRHHDFAVSFFDHLRLHSDPNTTRLVIHANDHAEPRDFMEIPQSPS